MGILDIFKQKPITKKLTEYHWSLSLAGITFENEDGTNRQELLKNMKDNDPVKLVKYTYEGQDAIKVLNADDHCIGNIKANDVSHVLPLLDSITKSFVFDVHSFRGELGDNIYIAKVIIYFMG
jgi:hypothetical protein